ncbi:hypothetical protein BUE80_DR001053 [Diplocarpon rosae]|nr:hypothetical protein BUE80_DR001053 [Diplocarpon rosae]
MRGRNKNTTYDGAVATTKPSLFQRLLRVFQFLSAFISLILFSVRLRKIMTLTHRASTSNGAVEGILAAAVLYTLIAMALRFLIKGTGSNGLRFLFIIFDLLFVGAFIAVAVLTSPARHGSSAPCRATRYMFSGDKVWRTPGKLNCNLPWGTFFLAILSTLLHAATAAWHALKDKRRVNNLDAAAAKEAHHDNALSQDTTAAQVNGDGYNGQSHV